MAYNPTYGIFRKTYGGFYGDATTQGAATNNSHWGYNTADTAATVEAAGYFNAAASLLQIGDILDCVMARGGTPVFKSYLVTANTGSAVTISLQSATAG